MATQTMHLACEPCRFSKRKCDRVIPACGRCTRLQSRCPIPFRWYMPRLLKHYNESIESSRVESNCKSAAYKLQSVWFQHALNDQCLFHVTLYIGSSYFDIKTGNTPSTITLHHQNEVIRIINERLSHPVEALDDCTVAAVALLALFSSLSSDQAASQVHTAGLRRLIRLKGEQGHNGQAGLDGLLATLIQMNDVVQSIIFGPGDSDTLLPQGYHVVPPLGLECRVMEYRALPYRLIESSERLSPMSSTLSDSTMNLFREIYAFKIEISRLGNATAYARRLALRGRRQEIHPPASLLSDDDPIHCCCVLAASIFWLLMEAHYHSEVDAEILSAESVAETLDRSTRQLKTALSLVDATAWLKSNPIAYCWVCMVGAAVARSTSVRVWFWVRQAAVLRILTAVDDSTFLDDLWVHVVWLRRLAAAVIS
ncbi:hypothetical protein ASPCAL04736 [Aspergillus calidoustus]|uniref:Zn(2)-C6 fungal-type domain-containing protein n=1 Tax=Aspergillus calidoustus TaxID=454130 RepID=A0A0U5G274_ASPCI|nr:hypothetical protein ASPCAL04736 [Aspergillus calidoustus]